jgi:hypothetical protein
MGIDEHDVLAGPDRLERELLRRDDEPLDRIGMVEGPEVETEIVE